MHEYQNVQLLQETSGGGGKLQGQAEGLLENAAVTSKLVYSE